jgi:hypothetical protein
MGLESPKKIWQRGVGYDVKRMGWTRLGQRLKKRCDCWAAELQRGTRRLKVDEEQRRQLDGWSEVLRSHLVNQNGVELWNHSKSRYTANLEVTRPDPRWYTDNSTVPFRFAAPPSMQVTRGVPNVRSVTLDNYSQQRRQHCWLIYNMYIMYKNSCAST